MQNTIAAFLTKRKPPKIQREKGPSTEHLASLKKAWSSLRDTLSGKFSIRSQTAFAKRLSFLVDAGVPLTDALSMLHEQASYKAEQEILSEIVKDTKQGQALSKSLTKHPRFFGRFAVQIVQVGESSGTLSESLVYLAEELRKRHILRQKLIGAFIYPAVLVTASIGIIVFLMVYLFPKILPIFQSLNSELPWTTQTVIALSSFLQLWGWLVLIFLVVLSLSIAYGLKRSERLRYLRDHALIRLPVIGNVFQQYYAANTSRTLGLLLKSGMRLSDALPVTKDTTPNLVYKRLYGELGEAVVRGEKISTYLAKERTYFPDMLVHMVAVGERSGTLSETLVYLSDMYDAEVDDFTKNLSTLVEPALMIVMGIIIGFIAVSIITPIYGITQNLHS